VVDIGSALHRIWAAEVNFTPKALKVGVVFLQGAPGLSQPSDASLEFIDLGGITAVKIGCSNGIPDRFGCGKSDEIANKGWVHRIDQPPFDNYIVSLPLSKGWVGRRRLGKIPGDKSQFVFARDVHLDNLGPEGIVGTVQLNTDRSSQVLDGHGRGQNCNDPPPMTQYCPLLAP
jgi:hypothetical protein